MLAVEAPDMLNHHYRDVETCPSLQSDPVHNVSQVSGEIEDGDSESNKSRIAGTEKHSPLLKLRTLPVRGPRLESGLGLHVHVPLHSRILPVFNNSFLMVYGNFFYIEVTKYLIGSEIGFLSQVRKIL